ncbi:putative NUDIX hydrolase [Serratia odorifera]|uniref:Putative NUDIX hydrolase n=1 Tax=Serratia odorifera TaxID=618 RepID=A0A447KWG4_SEROD|nr:putative NUDIX hydrolase [Serratia odorifera]
MSQPTYPASLADFISRFQLQLPQASRISHNVRPAAVLVPIICRPEPTLLLTRRADTLRKHAGQVAFPGGKTDASDASATFTALREAQEEVAIPPAAVTVLGQMAPLDSSTGFQVTPIVGLIAPDVQFHAMKTKWQTCSKCRYMKH